MEKLEAIDEEFFQLLICQICYEDYDDNEKKPYALECGHTICIECLNMLYQKYSNPKCPFDNNYFTVLPMDLSVNYVVLNMVCVIKAKSEERKKKMVKIIFNDGEYEGEVRYANNNPRKEGTGIMRYNDGSEYNGDWKDNCISGHGKMKYANGDVYNGEWVNNSPNGRGSFTYHSGAVREYIGTWKDGKGFGFGKVVYENGSTKETIYNKGLPCCNIIKKTYSDNTTFLGQIEKNEVIGNGYEITGDGNIFIGPYKIVNSKEMKDGAFTVYFSNGNEYNGKMVNGNPEGSGLMKYANGDSYQGELYNYCKEGNGVMTYANCDCYEGEWRRDMRTGKGKMIYHDNNGEYNGEWLYDKKHGTGKLVQGKYSYDGNWVNDGKEGSGIEIVGNGEFYCGEYKNNKKEGQGLLTFKTGEVYKGLLKNNKMDGQGLLIKSDNQEISGLWRNGMLIDTKDNKDKNCLIF